MNVILIFKNKRVFKILVFLILIVVFSFIFRYKEIVTYDYKGEKIRITMDRITMKSFTANPCDFYNEWNSGDLYYVVFEGKKKILKLKGNKSGISCAQLDNQCSYISKDTLEIFYRWGEAFHLKLPLDGKQYKINELKVSGYKSNQGFRCEDLYNGYGGNVTGKCTEGEIRDFLKYGIADY